MAKINITKEIVVNFALFSSLLYSAFLLPYVIFVNRNIASPSWIFLYVLAMLVYLVLWIIDKRDFFKYEFRY